MKIAIAADHVGFDLKHKLIPYLKHLGHEVEDHGAHEFDSGDDYPDFIMPAARAVAEGKADRAIVIGSSGQGEAIAANRIKGARAMVYYGHVEPLKESRKAGPRVDLITSSREDNDSNVLALGASFVSFEDAEQIVKRWLETPFTGEARHQRRINKLDA